MANRIPSDFRLPSFRSFEALDDGRPPSRMQALTASPERSHQQAAQHPQQTTRPNLPSGRTSLPSIPQLISRPSIGSSTDLPMHDSPRQWAATKSQAATTLPSPSRQPVLQSTQPLEDSSSRRETAESKSFAHPFFDRGRKPHLLRSPSFEEGKGKQKTIEGNPLEEAYVALSAAAELCANAVKEERRFLSTAAHDAAVAAAERAWRILRDSGPKVYRIGEPYPPVLHSLVSQESDLHHSSGTISLPAIAEKRPKEMDGFSSQSIFGLSDSARSHAVNNSFPHHHPVHTPRLAKDGVYEAQGPDVSTVDLGGSTANISPHQADVDGASPTLPIPQGIHGDGPPRPPVAVARVQRSTTHEESHQQLPQEDAHMDQEEASYMYAPPGIRNRLAKMRQQQPSVMAPSPPKKEIQQPRPVESAAPSQAGSVLRSSGDSNASSSSMRHLPASRESISSPRASGLPGHSTVEGIDKTRPAMYRHVSQRSDGHDHPLHYPLEGSGEASTASNSPDNTVKYKKRSRAPAPESCKSCGTTETPEWRRGPDGARTLCNACGLHFAKLAKKTDAPCDARAPATAQRSTQQPIMQQSQQHPYSHPSHHYPAHQTSQPIKTLPPMMMPSALYHQEQQQQQQQDASSRTQMPHHPLSHSSIQQQQQQHQQQSHFYTQSPRQQSFDSRGPGSASSPRAPRYPSGQQQRR